MRQHHQLEEAIKTIDSAKHPIPEDWPYADARRLFAEPDVTDAANVEASCRGRRDGTSTGSKPTERLLTPPAQLQWKRPDEAGMVEFLVKEKGFRYAQASAPSSTAFLFMRALKLLFASRCNVTARSVSSAALKSSPSIYALRRKAVSTLSLPVSPRRLSAQASARRRVAKRSQRTEQSERKGRAGVAGFERRKERRRSAVVGSRRRRKRAQYMTPLGSSGMLDFDFNCR